MRRIIKCGVFVASAQLLVAVNALLCRYGIIADTAWFYLLLLILLVVMPAYFFVKGADPKPWRHMLFVAAFHAVLAVGILLVLNPPFHDWNTGMMFWLMYWSEILLSVALGIAIAVDAGINLVRRK